MGSYQGGLQVCRNMALLNGTFRAVLDSKQLSFKTKLNGACNGCPRCDVDGEIGA